ncbi:hypothetical protein CEV08_05585 [Bartonella tribocorum]|uniref:Uncharacterized protein n=1 Tax=Bartonella tribocorum TaxID=85701 RepID=A0A2M6UUE1_9HYPH|nr:hypothetical protein CEV08_05585 [Bartonella tribocorum]
MLTIYEDESTLYLKKCNGKKQKRGVLISYRRELGTAKIIIRGYNQKPQYSFWLLYKLQNAMLLLNQKKLLIVWHLPIWNDNIIQR